ncbi:MAG: signal transduction histidine kinase, partial [Natronomonas sp.]
AVSHGTGLGLWLVYWVVDLSEGMLTFDHAENTGNVVTVMLPRTDD